MRDAKPPGRPGPPMPTSGSAATSISRIPPAGAWKAGDKYAGVGTGLYFNQAVSTRERRVQGIGNSESFGVGVRVIGDGTSGFAATPDVTPESVARAATRAVAIAKANARVQA